MLVILLMSVSALWIAREMAAYRLYQMDMDEATHALRGFDLFAALKNGDLAELRHQLTKPHWYPPGNGLLLAGWYFIASPNILTARLFSTLCYFLLGLLLWFFAREIIPQALPFFWLLPPLLLAADALHILYAAQSMLEIPVALYLFASLFFFTRAYRTNRWLDHMLAAVFALLAFFGKYNFGLVALGTIGVCSLIFYGRKLLRLKLSPGNYPLLASWGLIALVLFTWLVALREWKWLLGYSTARSDNFTFWSLANFTYYPQLLITHPHQFAGGDLDDRGGSHLDPAAEISFEPATSTGGIYPQPGHAHRCAVQNSPLWHDPLSPNLDWGCGRGE